MSHDLVVYRATPAGIMAATTASRLGMSAIIVEPSRYIGGLMTSGLNATDSVDTNIITGIAREFFRRVQDHYGTQYLGVRAESKVAKKIFSEMLAADDIQVLHGNDIKNVEKSATSIQSVILDDGSKITGKWFIDASYEGDLLARSGISFMLGRDAASDHNEEWAGVQKVKPFLPWGISKKIKPKVDGEYLPYVYPYNNAPIGSRDENVQSYCIRVTLTNNQKNIRPITAPKEFDFSQFDFFRNLASNIGKSAVRCSWHAGMGMTIKSGYFNLAEIPNGKFDMNSGPLAPINNPYLTEGWVNANLAQREKMTESFMRYTKAILFFIQNDTSVPYAVQSFFSNFGFPADEYMDSENFPPQVYVREGRRLLGEKVFSQNHIESGGVDSADAICHGKYHLDCKPVRWSANKDGTNVVREGMFFSNTAYKYALPSWVILPKRHEAENFFSVCGVSASHVAFGSIRMEPTWMELGSAAAMLAYLSGTMDIPIHDIPAQAIRQLKDDRFKVA